MMPQAQGNPALAQVQQMLAAKGMGGNPSDPFTFIHALQCDR